MFVVNVIILLHLCTAITPHSSPNSSGREIVGPNSADSDGTSGDSASSTGFESFSTDNDYALYDDDEDSSSLETTSDEATAVGTQRYFENPTEFGPNFEYSSSSNSDDRSFVEFELDGETIETRPSQNYESLKASDKPLRIEGGLWFNWAMIDMNEKLVMNGLPTGSFHSRQSHDNNSLTSSGASVEHFQVAGREENGLERSDSNEWDGFSSAENGSVRFH